MSADTRPLALIADDDPDYLEQMRLWFEREGFEVAAAGSELEARTLLRRRRPDVAVVDLMMERLDAGFTLAHAVKQTDPAIPVLLITGVTAETGLDFEATSPEGRPWIKADAVLAKPVRFEQVRRELERLGVRRG
ncbi:response regulator [bacterium]|nr:response regulator [bacterium]HPF36118.1 response regulator [Candidatus Krumholzibacteria bacterium]HRX52449.1 response regulator [Candidatus Krumholzibacteria bacterium]